MSNVKCQMLNVKRGFTLIELLLYVAVSSAMLLIIIFFLFTLLESRIKNQAIAEVEQQGLQMMQIITQSARNANIINSPAQGLSSASLSLNVVMAENNPTIFDLSNNIIRIKEGSSLAIALSNSHVIASGLIFQNLSRSNTPGVIRIQFILTHRNLENRNEYNFSKTFTSSASLR